MLKSSEQLQPHPIPLIPLLPKNCMQECRLVPNSDCGEIMTDWLWVFLAYACTVACVGLKKELFTQLSIVIKYFLALWLKILDGMYFTKQCKQTTCVFSPCVFLAALLYIDVRRYVHVLTPACSQCLRAAETSDKDPRRHFEFQYHTHTHGHTNVGLVVGRANKEIIMRWDINNWVITGAWHFYFCLFATSNHYHWIFFKKWTGLQLRFFT